MNEYVLTWIGANSVFLIGAVFRYAKLFTEVEQIKRENQELREQCNLVTLTIGKVEGIDGKLTNLQTSLHNLRNDVMKLYSREFGK